MGSIILILVTRFGAVFVLLIPRKSTYMDGIRYDNYTVTDVQVVSNDRLMSYQAHIKMIK